MTNLERSLKIVSFIDLDAWKRSHELVLSVYKITKTFPRSETYGLMVQMRRSSLSITSNIAEGFSRRSAKEKMQFFSTALGSLTELQNQFILCKDVQYITPDCFQELYDLTIRIQQLIRGLMKYLKLSC